MTSSRSPVSSRSDASWCGRGLWGPSSFTGHPLDSGGGGWVWVPGDFSSSLLSLPANWQLFSMSNHPGEPWILFFILFQETSVVWSGQGSAEMSCLRREECRRTDILHPQLGLLWGMWVSRDGAGTRSPPGHPSCQPARGREAAQEELNPQPPNREHWSGPMPRCKENW